MANVITIEVTKIPNLGDLVKLFDNNSKLVGDRVTVNSKDGYTVEMVRKYTYQKGGVIKTNFLHGKGYYKGEFKNTFKENKNGTFKVIY